MTKLKYEDLSEGEKQEFNRLSHGAKEADKYFDRINGEKASGLYWMKCVLTLGTYAIKDGGESILRMSAGAISLKRSTNFIGVVAKKRGVSSLDDIDVDSFGLASPITKQRLK